MVREWMLDHDSLCLIAEKFMFKNRWGVVFHDKFRAVTETGEQPDCLAFRNGVSCLIECKTSKADFLADAKKKFRVDPELGMGDYRFYMAPKGLLKPDDLPEGWGLLETDGKRVFKTYGWTNMWMSNKPFSGNKQAECDYMYSALRRMVIRGHFKEIYEGIPKESKE